MKKVLVTGPAGFIGSHLVESLIRSGYEVRAFVHYNSGNKIGWLSSLPEEVLNEIELFPGDIRDSERVGNAAKDIDLIFHLAALIAIPHSYTSVRSYVETNVVGTLNILESARKNKVERLIHTSTSEVYGSAQYVPIDERHPQVGQSPYSASKIGADKLAESYFKSFGTPVTIIRPFNTYGPRQSNRAVIPTIITQALSGNEVKLGVLDTTRDFSYVADTVSGFMATMKVSKIEGETINLGTGYDVSVEQVVSLISQILGRDLRIQVDQLRFRPTKSEVNQLQSCNARAKQLLDWSPTLEGEKGLLEGLRNTIDWFKEADNLAHYSNTEYTL
jgi:dTDP-glucose 4,6-dehydratase